MAGSEPLIQEASPHITKLAIEARMKDKDGQKKGFYNSLNLKNVWLRLFRLFGTGQGWNLNAYYAEFDNKEMAGLGES